MSSRHIIRLMSDYPSDRADKFLLRLPDGMRQEISNAAKAANRTMTAEIVQRLEQSFRPSTPLAMPFHVTDLVADYAEKAGVAFNEALAALVMSGSAPGAPVVINLTVEAGGTIRGLNAALKQLSASVPPDATLHLDTRPTSPKQGSSKRPK